MFIIMSTKKEIKNYVDENLKRGYSKDQIKNALLKSYSEKDIMKILIERPEPKLFLQYKKFQNWLIVFIVASLLSRFWDAFEIGVAKGAELGTGAGIGIIMGFVSLILPGLFFIALIKSRGWSYIIFFGYGLLNLLYSIPSFLITLFTEIPAEFLIEVTATQIRMTLIFLFVIDFVIYLGVTILSYYCWKKIHPDYKLKHIFTV